MSNEALTFQSVDVVRAPGFESSGFSLENLSEQVNIVHGPNAAGKTTLARAIQVLLWPEKAREQETLAGRFRLDGDTWSVDVDGSLSWYQRDGEDVERPSLPSSDQRDRYRLALQDLLQTDTRNEQFGQAVQRASAGGYDLRKAVEELEFEDRILSSRIREAERARNRLQECNKARENVQELRQEEMKLSSLERRMKEARSARRKAEVLDGVKTFQKLRQEKQELEARIEQLPDGVEKVRGNEEDRMKSLEKGIKQKKEELEGANRKISEAEEQIEQLALPDEGVPDGLIRELEEKQDQIRDAAERMEQNQENRETALKQRRKIQQEFAREVSEEELEQLDPADMSELEALAKDALQLRKRRAAMEAFRDWLKPDDDRDHPPDERRRTLERGQEALERWLRSGTGDGAGRDLRTFSVWTALIIAVLALLGAFLHLASLVLLVLAAGVLLIGYLLAETAGTRNRRKMAKEEFRKLDLDGPSNWSVEEVRERHDELIRERARLAVREEKWQLWDARKKDREALDNSEEDLNDRRASIRDRLGLSPDGADTPLYLIADRLRRWKDMNETVRETEKRINRIEESLQEHTRDFAERIRPFLGQVSISGPSEAAGKIRDLAERKEAHDSAVDQLARARNDRKNTNEELQRLREERNSIYERLNLEERDREQLRAICSKASEHESLEDERRDRAGRMKQVRTRIESLSAFEEEMLSWAPSRVEEEREEAQGRADEHEDLQEQIQKIKSRLETARERADVETALARKERALDELAEVLKKNYDAVAGALLADHVDRETSRETRPEVFERARDLLSRITRGRYELRFDARSGDGTFRAYDTVRERGCSLSELSDGTRLQLLLSVRMAFVEQQEKNRRLPLLMDETLANTDDQKATTIIRSTLELARQGRQLFYFTAQGDEVAKWRHEIDRDGKVDHEIHDLANVQDLDKQVSIPDLARFETPETDPPEPDGADHMSYRAKLDVPPFSPRAPVGRLHLWYLTEDPQLLHRLLSAGIRRWGQLQQLMDTGSAQAWVEDPDRRATLKAHAEAVEVFIENWRVGRGRPVDREALRETDGVTDNFYEEVVELNDEVGGDAETLLQKLKESAVTGFRTSKRKELREYLETNGYIDPRDPLDPSAIRLRMIARLRERNVPEEEARNRVDRLLRRLNPEAVSDSNTGGPQEEAG